MAEWRLCGMYCVFHRLSVYKQNFMNLIKSRCLLSLCAAAVLAGALSSCRSPRDVTYFSELEAGTVQEINSVKDITVRPDDRLSILVVSKDPQLAALYNLPMMAHRVGQPGVSTSPTSGNNEVASYVVDQYGDIQFPQLGTLHIEGMRRNEVADYIREQLITRNQIKDPVVVVDFLNHGVTVLGEVNKPGRVNFDRDRFTILDALAGAGDLTIQGQRKDILVTRIEDGRQMAYRLDLTNSAQTVQSPAFYLQQDDVVYVSPNDVRKRQTTANGNAPLTPSFWISIASLATTIAVLIWK